MTAPDPFLGRQVGGYVITRRLGEGGMGAVYLAENPELLCKGSSLILFFCREDQPADTVLFLRVPVDVARYHHPSKRVEPEMEFCYCNKVLFDIFVREYE